VLLSQTGSSQVLAVDGGKFGGALPKQTQTLFRAGQKNVVTLLVTNLDLMENEGATSLRVIYFKKAAKPLSSKPKN